MLKYTDFDRFKIDMPYPHRQDFDTYNVYCRGKVIVNDATTSYLIELANNCIDECSVKTTYRYEAIKTLEKNGYFVETMSNDNTWKEAQVIYNNIKKGQIDYWMKELSEHYDIDLINDPIGQKIFSEAWDRGHSAGYQEVDMYIGSIIEFVDDILDNVNNSEYSKSRLNRNK